jgi:hypothetical protein
VIVGGESGARARPMQKEWVLSLRDQCRRRSVPFFFKQWGGVRKAAAGRQLDGRTYDEFPTRVSHPVMLAGDCALAAREAAGFSLSTNIFPVTLLAHQSEEKRC